MNNTFYLRGILIALSCITVIIFNKKNDKMYYSSSKRKRKKINRNLVNCEFFYCYY